MRNPEFDYDVDGNLIRITLLGDGRTPAAVTAMTYDDAGNLVSLTDPEGHTTTFTHDIMGNVLTRTDGVGLTSAPGIPKPPPPLKNRFS